MRPKVMDDEIINQIRRGIVAKEITICENCDTIFSYSPNRKYCDECQKDWKKWPSTSPQYKREYYQKNKSRICENRREYRKNNWEKVRVWERKSDERRRRKINET